MTACDVVTRLPALGLAFISYVCDWMQAIVLPRSGFCFVKQENHLGGAAWLVSPTALIGEMFQSSSWQQSGSEDHVIEHKWQAPDMQRRLTFKLPACTSCNKRVGEWAPVKGRRALVPGQAGLV